MNYYDICLAVLGIGLLVCLFVLFGRKYSIIHPINVSIITVLFEFYGKYIWNVWGDPLEPPGLEYTNALMFIFLFLFAFLVLLLLFPANKKAGGPVPPHSMMSMELSGSTAVGMLVAAFSLNALFAVVAGGSPLYGLINPIEFRIFMQRGGMFYVEFVIFFLLISGLSLITARAMRNGSLLRIGFVLPYLVAAYVALNTGLRGRFIEILLVPIIIYAVRNGRLPRVALSLLAAILIPFVVVFGMYRDAVRGNSLSISEVIDFVGQAFTTSSTAFFPFFMHRFDAFDNFVRVMETTPPGFIYFQSFIDFISQPVPRAFWPTKANNFTSEMTMHFRPDLFDAGIALTFSAFSEAYLNFGFLLGPVVLALYLYALVSILQGLANNSIRNDVSMVCFCLLYQLPFIALSAGFINDVASVLVLLTLGCLWGVSVLKRLRI